MRGALSGHRAGRAFKALGVGLTLAAVAYVAATLWDSAVWATLSETPGLIGAVVLSGLAYGGLSVLLSAGWWAVLAALRGAPVGFLAAHRVLAASQIAKYLPGNVFHLVGRAALGRGEVGSLRLVAASLVWEAVLLSAAAAVLCAPQAGVILWRLAGDRLAAPAVAASAAAVALAVLIGAALAWRRRPLLAGLWPSIRLHPLGAAGALVAFLLFFLGAGLLLALLLGVLADGAPGPGQVAGVVSANALAWLLGFLTPGAVAGIGIREAVLLASLQGPWGVEAAGAAVLAYRMATVLGDLAFFATALAVRRRGRPPR